MLYYSNNNFELHLGDCLDVLKRFKSNSIDMIFADPPYYLSDGTITCQNGKMVSVKKGDWDLASDFKEKAMFHRRWIRTCRRVLKPNGTIWISGTYHSIYQCGYELQKQGYKIINDIAWYKTNAPPHLARKCFTASHETLLWAVKNPDKKFYFNYNLMKMGNWDKDFLKKPGKQMRSVWSIPSTPPREKKEGKHPTQKPLTLLNRIIMASSNEGDTVLDPFSGSGTTGIAANLHNRNYIGIDINKNYLDLSIKRYKRGIENELF